MPLKKTSKMTQLDSGMYDQTMVNGAVGLAQALASGQDAKTAIAQNKTFPKFAGIIVQAWAQGKDPVQVITDYINRKNAKRGGRDD